MKKVNLYIEIVSSNDKKLSSMNADSRQSALEVLSKKYSKVRISLIDNLEDLDKLVEKKPDLVFMGMKFVEDNLKENKIWLSEYFDERGITYTGSSKGSQSVEYNKNQAKEAVSKVGLKTAEFLFIENGEKSHQMLLPDFPLFVKPTDLGGGSGIDTDSLVKNLAELNIKVKSIFDEFGSDSIAEKYLSGREYSVAILKNEDDNNYLLMPLELVAPLNDKGDRFLSNKIKKADTETYSKVIDKAVFDSITELAMDAFIALGARDYGRIDIRYDSEGTAHFLEANLIPSLLRDYGNFPKACLLNNNIDYESVINKIVDLTLKRKNAFRDIEVKTPLLPLLLPRTAS